MVMGARDLTCDLKLAFYYSKLLFSLQEWVLT